MPNSWGKLKLAPLEPVWSHPWTAADREQITTVRYKALGCRHLSWELGEKWLIKKAAGERTDDFVPQNLAVGLVKEGELFVVRRVLGDKCALLENLHVLIETFLFHEFFDLGQQSILGYAMQRVLDPWTRQPSGRA